MRHFLSKALFASFALILGFGVLPAAAGDGFTPETTPIIGISAFWACGISDDGRWVAGADADVQQAGTYAAKLIDMQTGTVVSVPSDIWVTALQLSDDGRYMTFAYVPIPTGTSHNAHIYQYDRITESTTQVTAEAHALDHLRTSPDGGLVFWTERTISGGGGLGIRRSLVWQRSSGQRVDVTLNVEGEHPSTPFSGSLRPWVALDDFHPEYYLWQPLTGSDQHIAAPSGLFPTDIVGVSLDGSRLAYSRWTGTGRENRLVIATPIGTIIAETTLSFGGVVNRTTSYNFSDSGDRLLIQSARYTDGISHPYKAEWDIPSNNITSLNLPTVVSQAVVDFSSPGVCATSSDLRWMIGRTFEPGVVRIDTQTVAPTPVDPSMLEGDQLSDQVQRLYRAYFLRAPDASGLTYWRLQRASGIALRSVSTEFAASPEFQQQYGSLDNAAFVDLIYQNVLGRAPDAGGRAHWIGVLDAGTSRGEVMLGFSESPEFIHTTGGSTPIFDARIAQINRLYLAHFDRAGDSGGLTYWFQQLKTGSSIADVATAFSTSPEFLATYGELDDSAFVDLVYQNVLGRPADVTGRAFWIQTLANGASRGVVMTNFSDSAEYILATNSISPTG